MHCAVPFTTENYHPSMSSGKDLPKGFAPALPPKPIHLNLVDWKTKRGLNDLTNGEVSTRSVDGIAKKHIYPHSLSDPSLYHHEDLESDPPARDSSGSLDKTKPASKGTGDQANSLDISLASPPTNGYQSVYEHTSVSGRSFPSRYERVSNEGFPLHRPPNSQHINSDPAGLIRTQVPANQQRDLSNYHHQQQQQHQLSKQTTRESSVGIGPKTHGSRDQPQARSSRDVRAHSRERYGMTGFVTVSQREFPRHEYYANKNADFSAKQLSQANKSQDFHNGLSKEFPAKPEFVQSKQGDFSTKQQEFKPAHTSQSLAAFKLQSRDNSVSCSPSQAVRANSVLKSIPGTSSPLREKVNSPQRITSPPIKLIDSQRVSSPPTKISEQRQNTDFSKSDAHTDKPQSKTSAPVGSPSSEASGHYVQKYPERDTSASSGKPTVCPAWESGYVCLPDKLNKPPSDQYNGGQDISPIPAPPQVIVAKSGGEKAIDSCEPKENIHIAPQSVPSNKLKQGNRLSPLGSDSTRNEKFIEFPEKDIITIGGKNSGIQDLKKLRNIHSQPNISSIPKIDIEAFNKLNKLHLNNHIIHERNISARPDGFMTPDSTDCGSLSKSSSDGDHILSRKRPPTKLKSKRRNILSFPQHLSIDEVRVMQRRQDSYCGSSSSDENRSSGHASMSDGHSSSPPVDTLPRHHHSRIGPKDDFSLSLENASGIEDIKQAIEHLTMRSQGSRTSYSTSTYSSMSGSESEPFRRLVRHSSLETINTNVTSADEFVWVDSHNRLVELQQLPWSNHDVLRVIQQGRIREQLDRVSMEAVPRMSYLLQRALVRIAREAQRLTRPLAMCSKREVSSAFRIVLPPVLSDSCNKACLRSAAMYTVCGDQLRQTKSARACLNLSVSRFMRWMCDVRIGKFIHEYAAVYLTAGMENLLEEMILQCLPAEKDQLLTATALEHAIANNGDLWGLLQPYAHINAGRSATGALCLPRWARGISIDRISTSSSLSDIEINTIDASMDSETHGGSSPTSSGSLTSGICGSISSNSNSDSNNYTTNSCGPINNSSRCSSSVTITHEDSSRNLKARLCGQTLEQMLLTTCVGSLVDLSEQVSRVAPLLHKATNPTGPPRIPVTWGPSALHALFYFMRCSQLEHAEHASRAPIQELVYERPYIVLPPLVEWVRVATAHTEHRHSTVVDKDDVMQAARLLLPGVDCPVRMIGYEELICPRRQLDEIECAKKFKVDLAFKMLSCGRTDLVSHALQLLPITKVNTVNEYGLTPLMLACIRGDEPMVLMLLDAGADVDAETPPTGPAYLMANPETQHWAALTYASIHGHITIARTLLENKANVEGGARLAEEKCTETPLQVAAAAGLIEMLSLLLSFGANPYLSTLMKDSLCYSAAAQRGCYAAIAVAAAHGQRTALHKLLSHPQHASSREVLSLEEILAEGASNQTSDRERRGRSHSAPDEVQSRYITGHNDSAQVIKLTKQQIKTLQEAMYHSAESGHLEMTLDLRNLGVPWTLHCWMHTLATAHEHRLESIIDQLLQDFLQDWPEDYSSQFVDECLPLLFTIFRYSKNEGTSLLLADIFSTCFGKDNIKDILDTSISAGARIDPKYVNNPELSDVQFRVEGRVFYAHKLILVNASPRFEQMLTSKVCEGNSPIVQIHDIRYDIFESVMQSLYKGGCENIEVDGVDVLELMAAANFFQLDSLLRYCEARCSQQVNLENVVSMYVHAKVYGAMQLLEYCQGFLLQNMVALLTYDDSVRRLIFGKKLHNHDVLSGLLLTLQGRIKSRASPRAGRK